MACEDRHDSKQVVVHDQGIAAEGHHPLPLCPVLVIDTGVAEDAIGEVGRALLGDEADLELTDFHPAMGPVEVRIHAGAGLQLQDLLLVI